MGQDELTVYADGTTTNNTVPMYVYYWDSYTRAQTVFPASDLAEMAGGTISAITFYTTSSNIPYTSVANFDVYLAEVDDASISAFIDRNDATDVLTNATAEFVADGTGGKVTLTFTTPYVYGGGNLLFGCDNNNDAGYKSIYFYGKSSTGSSISGYTYTEGATISPSQRSFLPKTTFTYTAAAVSCEKPTNLVVDYQGSTATATWDGTASSYNVDVNGVVYPGETSPYVFAVQPNTTYTVKVQADCGNDDLSFWTSAAPFTTPCEAFALPYSYGFEDPTDLACWDVIAENSSTGINSATDAPEGSNIFQFNYHETGAYLVSPVLSGTENGLEVTFQYMNYSSTTTYIEQFQVGYTTNAVESDPSNYTYGETIYGEGSWLIYDNTFPANTKRIAIKYIYTDAFYLRLDDFNFEVPSDCKKPTNLTATEVGNHSAKLSWVENGEARAWNLKVNGEVLPDEIDENPYILSGLAAATTYTVQVAPVCEVEKWSDEITFTTEIACAAPTALSVAPMPESATITWNGSADAYEMEYAILGEGGAGGTYTYAFEEDLEGWTGLVVNADQGEWLHSSNQPYGYDYSEIAHGGTGFALCYSFVDYTGSFDTDAYLISPMMYSLNAGASLNFWYDMANDTYPEYFEVCVATAANPTASDFTAIWTWSEAKGMLDPSRKVLMSRGDVRHVNNSRYDNWREVTVDLSAYVGQTVWIALHDVNYDMYEVWIDDLTVNAGTAADITWIPVEGPVTSPYTLEGLEPGTAYMVRVHADCGEDGESVWTTTMFTTPTYCDVPTGLNATNVMATTATVNWTGYQDGFEVRYRKAEAYEAIIEETFENGIPSTWTIINNDEDEYNWLALSDIPSTYSAYAEADLSSWAHNGSNAAASASYINNIGDLTTDQYLVSPQLTLNGTLRFFVKSTDGSYLDSYEVLLSLTGTNIADFTITLQGLEDAPYSSWGEVALDMSAYAGQQGYIAIHHVDSGQYFLIIDDFGLYNEVENDWETTTTDALSAFLEGLDPETEYEWQVRGENRDCSEEGYTDWSAVSTFTTHGICDPFEDLWLEDLTATSITLGWEAYQESYTMRYRTAGSADEVFYDDFTGMTDLDGDEYITILDFEDGSWTYSDLNADSDIYTLNFTDGSTMTVFGFVGDGTDQYLVSPEFESLESVGVLEFYYNAYQASTQTFAVGFSSTDNALTSFDWQPAFTNGSDDYVNYYQIEVPAGTKYFAIKSSGESSYLLLSEFFVGDNYVPYGQWVTIEDITGDSYTITDLIPNTEYQVQITGNCSETETTGWIGGYITTLEQTNITQTLELTEGWNWVSLYVEFEDAEQALLALEEALGEHGLKISAMDDYTTYEDDEWGAMGDLEELTNDQMYMVLVDEDIEVEIEGMPSNPADYTITILADNWTWIGFPSAEALAIEVAFADFEAEDGDKIQGVEDYSKYEDGEWGAMGDLEELTPGQGYMYFYNGTEDQDLVISTGAKMRFALKSTSSFNREKKTAKVSDIQKLSVK